MDTKDTGDSKPSNTDSGNHMRSSAQTQSSNQPTNSSQKPQAYTGQTLAHQSQIKSSQITTALIILIVFLLFVMLILSMNGKFARVGGTNSNLTALQINNEQLRAEANAERARNGLPPLPSGYADAYNTAQRIRSDANSIASLVGQWETLLETKDSVIGELRADMASRDKTTQDLYSQITYLQNQVSKSSGAVDQLTTLSNQLKIANEQIDQYRTKISEFQARPTNEQVANLRQQLNESLDQRNKLQFQVEELLKSADSNSGTELYDEALTEIENLRAQNREQRFEMQRLRADLDRSSIFIESAKDLPAEAAKLYAKLNSLEESDQTQLEAAYENIRETMNAEIIHRQTFSKGSSKIAFDREKIIQNILDKRKDRKSFFLVVGYASKSGESEDNRKLSCRRATTVASVVNMLKASDQEVKAVYLGETKRFSEANELDNQICEIWEIKI